MSKDFIIYFVPTFVGMVVLQILFLSCVDYILAKMNKNNEETDEESQDEI